MRSIGFVGPTAGGRFTRRGVPPGEYEIHALSGVNPDTPHDKRGAQLGHTRFRVDAADVTGLVVTLSKAARISGRIVPEDAPLPPGAKLLVQAVLDRSLTRTTALSRAVAVHAADLSFEIEDVFGPAELMVQGMPRGWMVKSVRTGGRDITGRETEFPSGRVTPVEIVVSSRGAAVSGVITEDSGKPATENTSVVVIPVNEGLAWRPEYPPGAPVREKGSFEVRGLRPGEYWIAAFDWAALVANYSRPDPALRARIAKVAERIVLGEGEKRTIDLRLAKLPDAR
jgi:hypothetical protein